MKRGLTGRYETSLSSGEPVQAFVPLPLPPKTPLDLGGGRARLLERAALACGRLDGFWSLLPDPEPFLYSHVRREAVLSSQIEGAQSSLFDLLLFELDEVPGAPFDDVVEVSNYVAAMEHGLERLRGGFPLANRLLREVHARLLARGRGSDKQPGAFRTSQNWIGGTRPGNARFVPPPPELVPDCMASLERFINGLEDAPAGTTASGASELPALVRAGVVHVQFETIHPFLDGNGRVGRLLIALMLADAKVLGQPLLYLSLYFKQHRAEYYRLLDAVRQEGDWEAWLDFFLEGVATTAQSAVDTAHRILALFGDDTRRVQELGRSAGNALRVLQALRARPIASIRALQERTGASHPTVSRGLDALRQAGIVREITGRRRRRLFVYHQFIAVLTDETKPPQQPSP